jgi:adenine-specific DNA-methyltransferase
LVPGAYQDGRIDWETLRAAVGDEPDLADRYGFTWVGKKSAMQLVHTSASGSLHPSLDKSIDWNATKNVFIEGENLEVLRVLYRAYFAKVRLIYIGPPYNAGKDRIYRDDAEDALGVYLNWLDNLDGDCPLSPPNPTTAPSYHSLWLSMLYPRLSLARHLLREDGFIVISVDDAEFHHLRLLLNEVFGEENHVATLIWERSRKNDAKLFSVGHDYMVVVAKNLQTLRDRGVVLRAPKEGLDELKELWEKLRDEHGDDFSVIEEGLKKFYSEFSEDDPRQPLARFRKADAGGPFRDDADISWPGAGGPRYEVLHPTTGKPCKIPSRGWVYPSAERMADAIRSGEVTFGSDETTVPALKSYIFEKSMQVMGSVHYSYAQKATQAFQALFDGKRVYDNPKHFEDIRGMVDYLTDDDDLILDFFAGSATTGHAVLESNQKNNSQRRFILVQLPEPVDKNAKSGKAALSLGLKTVSDVGRARLDRAIQIIREDKQKGSKDADGLGFRVFELGESVFLPAPEETQGEINADMFLNRIRSNADELAIVWELILREGFPLTSQIRILDIRGCSVYRVDDDQVERSFFACLDGQIPLSLVATLEIEIHQTFLCRDTALTDEVSVNLGKRCHLKTF